MDLICTVKYINWDYKPAGMYNRAPFINFFFFTYTILHTFFFI